MPALPQALTSQSSQLLSPADLCDPHEGGPRNGPPESTYLNRGWMSMLRLFISRVRGPQCGAVQPREEMQSSGSSSGIFREGPSWALVVHSLLQSPQFLGFSQWCFCLSVVYQLLLWWGLRKIEMGTINVAILTYMLFNVMLMLCDTLYLAPAVWWPRQYQHNSFYIFCFLCSNTQI